MPSKLLLGRRNAVGAPRFSKRSEPTVSASEFRELQVQVRELQRLLRRKLLENEILKEAMSAARKRSGRRSTRQYRR
jgi:transposase